MLLHFNKYQGTGNDFILIDNRKNNISLTTAQIEKLCDRRFGVGADGLILLSNNNPAFDFEMKYYNADGNEGTMCGNGSRCITRFAHTLNIHRETYRFLAADGPHESVIGSDGIISLKMNDVKSIKKVGEDFIVDTGSPHYVKSVLHVTEVDVYTKGREIRYSPEFKKEGINVNFAERKENVDQITIRTYERGVENETYSCGTGATAAALVNYCNEDGPNSINVATLGGALTVKYTRKSNGGYENIWLCGTAEKVYEGTIEID